jgi:hypothetical protein
LSLSASPEGPQRLHHRLAARREDDRHVVLAAPAVEAVRHPQPGGVEEGHLAQVHHHALGGRPVELREQPLELVARAQIDVAAQHDP